MSSSLSLLSARQPNYIHQAMPPAATAEQYPYNGQYGAYTFNNGNQIISTDGIVESLRVASEKSVSILDIGAGCGQLVVRQLQEGNQAHGVTRYDYTKHPDAVYKTICPPPQNYFEGDAHDLSQFPSLLSEYQLVCSARCLRHMVDPLACVEQAANLVAPGGVLAVDRFRLARLPGLGPRQVTGLTVFTALQEYGFVPLGAASGAALYQELEKPATLKVRNTPDFVLRRQTQHEVRLAVEHAGVVDGAAAYARL